MSRRQPVVSGAHLIRALERDGWNVVGQRGSHGRLKKAGRRNALVVPLHKEIRKGTLGGILSATRASRPTTSAISCRAISGALTT